ncbi:MAG: N-ATPase subunit AtpR [Gammaproteobacteria bacterium]
MTNSASALTELLFAAGSGIMLGWAYYGGLWLTLRSIIHWRHPAFAMLASLMIRVAFVAIGLYVVADGRWQSYLAAVPGLLTARWWWIRRIQIKQADQ